MIIKFNIFIRFKSDDILPRKRAMCSNTNVVNYYVIFMFLKLLVSLIYQIDYMEDNIFNAATFSELKNRFQKINFDTKPQWGKMNAAQVLAHCREVQEACNGKELKKTPFILKLFGKLIKKSVVNIKSYPKNSRTHPQYIISEHSNFETERTLFFDSLEKFYENKGSAKHTIFGEMTPEERSKAILTHHRHHLDQFGV